MLPEVEGLNELLDDMGGQETARNFRTLMARWRKMKREIERQCSAPEMPDGEMQRWLTSIYQTLRWQHFAKIRRTAWRKSKRYLDKRKQYDATYHQKARTTSEAKAKKSEYDKARYARKLGAK